MYFVRKGSSGDSAAGVDGNRRHYQRRSIGALYARQSGLQTAEAVILSSFHREIAGGRVLDLGVGGGRTTPFLLQLSWDYVGIDYSPQMIERCRYRYPLANFQVVDARDLSTFPDASFDFAFFSNNGIDAVGHDDRLKILREVHRKLKSGGLFVFSSHNRNARVPKPWNLQQFDVNPLRSPLRFGKRLAAYPMGIINYLRLAPANEMHTDYCIEVDAGNLYSLMHYRITGKAGKAQLKRVGFRAIETFGIDGRQLSPRELETVDDWWIHYACRR
ncbi:MAG TPA: class I SAM-dependent methyltransferase [Sphingomicrobium sp.]|jgi:SAM-dependent methyltransferase